MHRLSVKDIMSTNLVTLDRSESLDIAEKAMSYGRIRHLPVVENGRLVGLVTHRDILRAQISSLAGVSPSERDEIETMVPVEKIMQRDVRTVTPDTPVLEAARIIRRNKIGCLPVVEDGRLVGIVTEADFIDLVIRALEDA
ncbi:MAG: CBS domain-containing protein [Deltaproteobacteria bacterium]|nr:MAG: CBS domain-containing protein [Deltaproteobacteria bacterium]